MAVHWWRSGCAVVVQWRCTGGAVAVHWWCNDGAVAVHWWRTVSDGVGVVFLFLLSSYLGAGENTQLWRLLFIGMASM